MKLSCLLPVLFSALLFCTACQKRPYPYQGGQYTGEMSDGLPQGFGCLQKDSSYYIGQWHQGQPHGFGRYCCKDTCYEGQFVHGQREGQGKLTTTRFTYEGSWKAGKYHGEGQLSDSLYKWSGQWKKGRLPYGCRKDSSSTYTGNFDGQLLPSGYGVHIHHDNMCLYEGHWKEGRHHDFGIEVESGLPVRLGWWKEGKYLGEKMAYNASRVYGIDISRYQHKTITVRKGKRRIRVASPIQWSQLSITHLGTRHNRNAMDHIDYPVSFCFIKSTQGVTIRSRFYQQDARDARRHGIKVGAYHFMSPISGKRQAQWFLRHTPIKDEDLPPVLDVELTEKQIAKMGGKSAMYREILAWMHMVEKTTGKRPILYVSQRFIEKYLYDGPKEILTYNVWIARYGEYRPYIKLLYWQLSPYGRVKGIHGDVDINVFNGSKEQFEQYVNNGWADLP